MVDSVLFGMVLVCGVENIWMKCVMLLCRWWNVLMILVICCVCVLFDSGLSVLILCVNGCF